MKRSLLIRIKEWYENKSKEPWACIEVSGSGENGIPFSMSWNKAFINQLTSQGFAGINEEDTVNNFMIFCASQLTNQNNTVESLELPRLSSEANSFKS